MLCERQAIPLKSLFFRPSGGWTGVSRDRNDRRVDLTFLRLILGSVCQS
jgi:hypothetical protein